MNIKIVLILIVILMFVVVFKYIEPLFSKHKIKNSNEYGSARFSTFNEINKNFKKEEVRRINQIGFPIWFDKDYKKVWMDNETPHWVYLGSTGSGKSVTQVITFCSFLSSAEIKRSAFITDPKGEIFNTTSKMFQDRGYEVLTIDFRNPEKSNKLNILEPIIKEYEKHILYEKKSLEVQNKKKKVEYNNKSMSSLAETNRLISSLADMIMKDKVEAKDPFWNNSARQLLEGLIGFFLKEYKLGNIQRNQITMTSIRKFQNSSMDEKNFEKFKSYLDTKKYGSKSKDSLTSVITASENTYKSITSVFGSKMSLFDDVNVANVTSSSDFDFDTLVTIVVGLLYRELVKLANIQENKKLTYQIDWLLDEFANCPPLADIEAIVSVARSRGMRFHFFIQSFAQLNNVYGKDVAQIILDNCGLVYLKTNTQDTAEEISKRLGKQTIESNSISQSVSLIDYNGNKSTSLMARDLLTPDEIKQLHYKMIIFPIIGYPIFRDTILYTKFSCYKKGNINRKIDSLKDLSYTYFVVEDINHESKNKDYNKEKLSKENQQFINEKLEQDKLLFEDIDNYIANIYTDVVYETNYKEVNFQTYLNIESPKLLSNKDILNISSTFSEKYYIEFDNNDGLQIINIHFKMLGL